MKPLSLPMLWVSLIIATLTALQPQNMRAEGATSTEISNAIVLEGSLPVQWENDATFPWTIQDGWLKSGNVGNRYTSSSIAFSYNSEHQTEILFNWWNQYSTYNHTVAYYVDGAYKGSTTTSSQNQIRMYLSKGRHTVEIRDSLADLTYEGAYAGLKNVKVTEIKGVEELLLTKNSMPLSFENDETFPWIPKNGYIESTNYANKGTSSTFKTSFTIDKVSKFSFNRRVRYASDSHHSCKFYINGKLYNSSSNATGWEYVSVVLQPGEYTMEWVDSNDLAYEEYYTQLRNVELHQNWIEVDVTPGTLGIEVLYKVNVLKDVHLLKINGDINSTDWATLKQMTNLHAVDFSNAHFDVVPVYAFDGLLSLSTVKLPAGVKGIYGGAFQNTNIYYITIPNSVEDIGAAAFYNTRLQYIDFEKDSKLKYIGYQAFENCAWLEEFIMPNSVTLLARYGNYSNDAYEANTFKNCTSLKKLAFSDNLETIPNSTCLGTKNLTNLHLPQSLKYIEQYAFRDNASLAKVNLPQSLISIGYSSFYNTAIDSICVPLKATNIGQYAFRDCQRLKYVELPSNISSYDYIFYNCYNIEKVVCPSATPPAISNDPFYGRTKSAMTLVVPSFAVVNYKLDNYWYQFGNIIEGDEIDYWKISGELSLVNNRRMEGKPDVDLTYGGRLIVSGNAPMTVGDFNIYVSEENPSRLLNSCNAFSADSIKTHFSVSANKWYFLTPMADVNIQDIKVNNTSSFVFRYYDGESRANTGTGSSWKNVTDSKLKAGQGYIFQCNAASVITFPVAAELHSQVLSTEAITIPLASHVTDNAANKNWNYVGNPYPCYYDIFYMDFTAPITVWNGNTYRAYSITDDNYVLRPMQGFFVQKPDAVDAITLQTAGKQIASTVNRPSYAPTRSSEMNKRSIFNIELLTDSVCDLTRVVLNDKASLSYEVECDATKFMSIETSNSQIYTIDSEDNRLSINERPEDNGTIKLGLFIGDKTKPHTISATRNDGEIYLRDLETNEVINLANQDYSFIPSENGYIDNRFTLTLKSPIASGIEETLYDSAIKVIGASGAIIVEADNIADISIYGIDGKLYSKSTVEKGKNIINIGAGLYVVKVGGRSYKVAVK